MEVLRPIAAALESAPDAVGIQRDGALVFANRGLVTLFGATRVEDLLGRDVLDFIAASSRPQVLAQLERRRRGEGSPSPFEVIGQRLDGSTFCLEVRATTIVLDDVPCSLAFLRDVTDQRQDEEARREREALYRAVFEVNAAIKLLIDPRDGRIVDANPAAAQFYGWSLDELRAMRIGDINVLTPAELASELERARTRRRTSFQFRHRTRSGAIADVEVHSGPIDLRGRTLLLSIIHDVTERKRFEEELRHARRLESIGRLAAGIAHDFNNLLTVISASAQLAARHGSPARVDACLSDIRAASQRGAELTRHLLALGREQALSPAAIELGRMLERTAELLQRVLGDAIVVHAEAEPDLPAVRVDPGQLELVLLNMALNARDAMPGGGRLALAARRAERVPPGLTGSYLALSVTDTGVGMDEDTRSRVFEPFFTTKPTGDGTGLGLAIAFGVVAQSEGTITVASRPGEGSCFTIYLPVHHGAGEPRAATASETGCFAGEVLLVDDRDDVRTSLHRLLGELGLTVHVARGAREAIDLLAARPVPIDLVLTDVSMPERSGVELAGDVAAAWPGVPVVLMSGNPVDRPPSAAAVLRKPFSIAELADVLRTSAPATVR